ncbi:hypothetical protein DERP_010668 [Dermatophagoides pteronyssinus]|uniref:Uncharacterized protein n=1 Tax=Dermatophagoides pteronyssinus TaxID=6956 RepID=A0ABQ8JAS2_DERPT|nr:hypothetical protein DERP_010668 [Dermatophagoides pteronyssinus]
MVKKETHAVLKFQLNWNQKKFDTYVYLLYFLLVDVDVDDNDERNPKFELKNLVVLNNTLFR